jgi:hypothetical protein
VEEDALRREGVLVTTDDTISPNVNVAMPSASAFTSVLSAFTSVASAFISVLGSLGLRANSSLCGK